MILKKWKRKTYGFISQLFDSAMKEGGLSHGGGDVPWYVELEIRVTAKIGTVSELFDVGFGTT